MKNYYFLSGLPRSGSTLLQSVLSENPKFHCEGNSPLMIYVRAMHFAVSEQGKEQLAANQKFQIAHNIVKSIPDLYYTNTERPIILDK
jgi:sulfotransferase